FGESDSGGKTDVVQEIVRGARVEPSNELDGPFANELERAARGAVGRGRRGERDLDDGQPQMRRLETDTAPSFGKAPCRGSWSRWSGGAHESSLSKGRARSVSTNFRHLRELRRGRGSFRDRRGSRVETRRDGSARGTTALLSARVCSVESSR